MTRHVLWYVWYAMYGMYGMYESSFQKVLCIAFNHSKWGGKVTFGPLRISFIVSVLDSQNGHTVAPLRSKKVIYCHRNEIVKRK